jgi:hypothetical protein
MKDFLKSIAALGITIGLSDRETFVKKASEIIEQYQSDPEKAEHLAKMFINYLEQMRNEIRMEKIIQNSKSDSESPAKKDIEELTNAIHQLTKQLKEGKNP